MVDVVSQILFCDDGSETHTFQQIIKLRNSAQRQITYVVEGIDFLFLEN